MSNYAPESGSKEASELRYRTLRNQAKQRERDALQAGLNSVIIALTSTGMGLAAAQAVSGLEKTCWCRCCNRTSRRCPGWNSILYETYRLTKLSAFA